MKKTNPFVAFVAGMLVMAVLLAGIAGIVSGQDDDDEMMTFTVVERATTDIVTDTGAEGDSVGDLLTFANEIYDEANENVIGSDNGYCVRTVAPGAWECNWTLTLEGGSITVEGPFLDSGDSVFAVTGGTGVYADASGQMTLTWRDEAGTEFNFIYELQD
jgi:hypothetical protein